MCFELAAQIMSRLGNVVTVIDEVGFDQKLDLMSSARALLFPIDWDEPFGLVMTEAMACGTPVIATPRGSVPEVVVDGQTGFVVIGAAALLATASGVNATMFGDANLAYLVAKSGEVPKNLDEL